jgi:hypothetical protein
MPTFPSIMLSNTSCEVSSNACVPMLMIFGAKNVDKMHVNKMKSLSRLR